MADLKDLIAYIEDGNKQAVENFQADPGSRDSMRWAGKSHAYQDVLAFIEHEMETEA